MKQHLQTIRLPTTITRTLLLLSALTGIVLLLYGFTKNPGILTQPIWDGLGFEHFRSYSICFFCMTTVIYFTCRSYLHIIVCALALLVGFSTMGVGSFFACALFIFSCLLLGKYIINFFSCQSLMQETIIALSLCTLLGIALIMLLTSIMVHFNINYPPVYWLLIFAPLFLNSAQTHAYLKQATRFFKPISYDNTKLYCSTTLLIFVLTLLFIEVLKPEVGADGLSTHLYIPSYVFHQHQWSFDFKNVTYALMPLGADWLYTFLFQLGGEYAARLLNFLFATGSALLLYAISRKWNTPSASILFTALYLSTPLLQLESSNLYLDNIWTFFLFASVITSMKFQKEKDIAYLILAAIFLGSAMATKTMSAFFILALAPFLLYQIIYKMHGSSSKKKLLIIFLIILFFGFSFFPYFYAYVTTDNPVFPFANNIFKSPYFNQTAFDNPQWKKSFDFYHATFHSHLYLESQDGAFGFQYLLLLPLACVAAILFPSYALFMSVVVGIFFIFTLSHTQAYLRYFYPALPLLTVAFLLSYQIVQKQFLTLYKLLILLLPPIILLNCFFMPSSGWWHKDFYIDNIFYADFNDYIKRMTPERKLMDVANTMSENPIVLLLSTPDFGTSTSATYRNNWLSNQFFQTLSKLKTAQAVCRFVQQHNIDYVIVPQHVHDPKIDTKATQEFVTQYTNEVYEYGVPSARIMLNKVKANCSSPALLGE